MFEICILLIVIMIIVIFIFILHKEHKQLAFELNKLIMGNYTKPKPYFFIYGTSRNLHRLITKLNLILQINEYRRKKNNKKLKQKYTQNAQLISLLCHEFKNPISIILGYCDLLDDSNNRDLAINKIQNQAKKIDTLLNRLYLAIRLENELVNIEISSFNLDEVIIEICNNFSKKYHKTISLKLNGTRINGDKILLETAISNLIENALKYAKSNVKIILKRNELKIIDDGNGIEDKDINQILKKFYRINCNYKESSLGLGLFIVKYALKLHNINLKIKSRIQKGSNFSFKIPKNLISKT